MKKAQNKRGFTLIEVLVVIGIIAILAAVVLVAVNPARQFKLARDSQRTANMEAIVNAIHQNMSEHRGSFVCGTAVRYLPTVFTMMTSSSTSGGDVAPCIVPDYISAMPFDPADPSAFYESTTSYNTAYELMENADGRITASSSGELVPTISATQ